MMTLRQYKYTSTQKGRDTETNEQRKKMEITIVEAIRIAKLPLVAFII